MTSEVIASSHVPREPIRLNRVRIEGIYAKNLRYDRENKRPVRILLKLDPGASYPPHNYPGGHELYVLEGEVQYGTQLLRKDDYLPTPPNPARVVSSETGCIILYLLAM